MNEPEESVLCSSQTPIKLPKFDSFDESLLKLINESNPEDSNSNCVEWEDIGLESKTTDENNNQKENKPKKRKNLKLMKYEHPVKKGKKATTEVEEDVRKFLKASSSKYIPKPKARKASSQEIKSKETVYTGRITRSRSTAL